MTYELNPSVPVGAELATVKGSTRMEVANQQVTIHFVHPTQSSKVLTATVGGASTPQYLIEQLVRSSFLTRPGEGAEYKLYDARTGRELADNITLAQAGVGPETTLNIVTSVTGA